MTATTAAAPQIDVVVPVYNEQAALEASIRRLHSYLHEQLPLDCRITIADNASTDGTLGIARRVAAQLPGVRVLHLDQKGRGRALRHAWLSSDAPVLAYMDVDLSTDLSALLPLVAPLLSGHSDVAIGTRLSPAARVVRGPKREFISRSYNHLLRWALRARFSDAQCGFKAIRADVARELLPAVADQAWFFDTELLVVAQRAGLRIHEVPVDWVDDPDSRVVIVDTAVKDLRGVWRMAVQQYAEPARFALIGVASTLAYLGLYAALRDAMAAQAANLLALLATALANTEANRRWTFGVRGRSGRLQHHMQGVAAFGIALAVTSGSLAAFHAAVPHPARLAEAAVLLAANLVATAVRFVLLRRGITGKRDRPARGPLCAPIRTELSDRDVAMAS